MRLQIALSILGVLATSGMASAQQWGDLEADFFLKGNAKAEPIIPDKDQAYCGKHKLVRENVVVDPKTKGIANIAIYLLPGPGKKVPVHPDYEKTAAASVKLDNKNCRFEPHILTVRTGQTLVLGNSDPLGHNSKVEFFNNPPFNDLIPAGGKVEKKFTQAESSFSKVECSIHAWMNAYILVKDDPYVGFSDTKGHLSIKNLPVGEWTFVVWQENTGYLNDVTLDGKPTKWTRGKVKINIKPGVNKLGKVEVTPAALKLK
ncbi:MAG: methylamine utilization protein [Pirellulaceae bacterium]